MITENSSQNEQETTLKRIQELILWFFMYEMPETLMELAHRYNDVFPDPEYVARRKKKVNGKWFYYEGGTRFKEAPIRPPWDMMVAEWLVRKANGYEPDDDEVPF